MSEHLASRKWARRKFLVRGLQLVQAGLFAFLVPETPCADESTGMANRQRILSFDLEATAKRLEDKLIAPCCFAQTVANHYSDVAARIKGQIRQMLAQGKTEQQILNSYVRVYGERILAEPVAQGFNWPAYLLPSLAVIAGIGGIILLLGRWRMAASENVADVAARSSDCRDAMPRLRARLARELARFEG
jgi:cytochrome c-type biogenesis protein CcmH/NrfF